MTAVTALLMTLAVEMPIVAFATFDRGKLLQKNRAWRRRLATWRRFHFWRKWRVWRVVGAAVLANLATHPAASWAYDGTFAMWWRLELAVWLFEAIFYFAVLPISLKRALAVSALANGATAGISALQFAFQP